MRGLDGGWFCPESVAADLGDTERMLLEEAFDTGRRAQVTLGRYDAEDVQPHRA
jgi:hypothetical protein